jgi:hypothetical protein
MHSRLIVTVGWAGFAVVVLCCCYLMLTACDLAIRPLFGLKYCAAQAGLGHLASQRARETDLKLRIHQAELQFARLPTCAEPPPVRPPRTQAERDRPATEELRIPQKVAELEGCWQSIRGDITLFTDDEKHLPVGDVRVCYCFADNGQGTTRYVYPDGARCVGPLRAGLSADRLTINHPQIDCSGNRGSVVPGEIDCRTAADGNSAICDWLSKGRFPRTRNGLKYRRVTEEYCR